MNIESFKYLSLLIKNKPGGIINLSLDPLRNILALIKILEWEKIKFITFS